MKIVFQRGACGNARVCPNINSTDRNTYVVQGYITEPPSAGDTASVEVPMSLLPELVSRPHREGLMFTDRDTVLVAGQRITDPETLTELALPDGEDAVEVPSSLLAELQEVQPC